jgi:UMF1 family MFS transporter
MNNKKTIRAWTFYDWANSVFPLVMATAIFPAFYEEVTKTGNSDIVNFLGIDIKNTVIYSYAISASYLIIAFLSPLLSGIADYSGRKKQFMFFFVLIGSLSSSSLFFFDGSNIHFGIFAYMLANIGFNGSLVFYNSYLPEITIPENYDKVSARGYSMGYIGSVILLIINILIINSGETLGLKNLVPVQLSFLSVGIWWFGFSLYSLTKLPRGQRKGKIDKNIIWSGYREVNKVFKKLSHVSKLKTYLSSFFFYSMGVQTVIYMAALFGSKELGIDTSKLIIAILIIQFLGVAGAELFARVSKSFGNKTALTSTLSIWIIVCISAYFVQGETGFYLLAALVGLVMGGVQSISRSTFSKLLPENVKNTASFFSFYELTEKLAIVVGTFSYGLIESLTGSMRLSSIGLSVFFILGIVILRFTKIEKN